MLVSNEGITMTEEENKPQTKEEKVAGAAGKIEYADASLKETIISADLPSDDSRPDVPKPKKKD